MNTNNHLEMFLTLNAEAFKKGLSVAGTGVRNLAGGATTAFQNLTSTGRSVDNLGTSASTANGKIKETTRQMGNLGSKSKGTSSALADVAGRLFKIAAIAGAALFSVKSAIDFESAMADVSKVVDGTASEIDDLRQSIVGMAREIPLTAVQLAAIAAEAGSLGIAVGDIEAFTRTVAKMSTAFDMTAEEAGNAIGKIKNIYGLSMAEMTGFGDTVNQLGNTTAAKEKEIVDSMMRIGGSAKQFGLSTKQAAALSAAFISLGKTPETAATAINSLLAKLQTAESQGQQFQEGLAGMGISASDLAEDIKNGPNEAIVNFLETLKGLDNADRAKALVNLFGTEFQDDIGVLVTGLDSYKLALGNVADASSYAGGMQKEFETRSKTTANQLILTKNAVNEIAINIGSFFLPTINSALKGVANFTNAIIDFLAAHPAFSAALASVGAGLKKLFTDISDSWAGDAIAAGIRSIISALEELSAMVNSGELGGYLQALGSQWSVWADDVKESINFVGRFFDGEMDVMQARGQGTVSFLIDAFRSFPSNVRAFIGLITVLAAAEFDKVMIRAKAFKDSVAALFNDQTVAGVMAERDRQLAIINEARDSTIDSILKERDVAIESTNAQIEAAKKLREEFEKRRAVELENQPADSGESTTADETKTTPEKKANDSATKKPVEPIKTKKEEDAAKKAAEKEQQRLAKEEEDRLKAILAEQKRYTSAIPAGDKLSVDTSNVALAEENRRLAKEQEADEQDQARRKRRSAGEDRQRGRERVASARQNEKDITRANDDRLASAKEGAREWAQTETQAVDKAKSAFQKYADKVKSIQNDIVGREKSLAQELDELDTSTPVESKWRRKAKEAREYEEAAKEAMKAGNLDQALSLSDQAKAAYSSLQGGAGKISDKVGDQTAYRGVKESGQLGIEIAKAIQQATAKTAMSTMSGTDMFGGLTARIRGQLAAVAGGGADNTVGKGTASPAKVHELRFKGGSLSGGAADVEALLSLLEQSGMSAA